MPTEFPFVNVPPEVIPAIGEKDGDSRIYRKRAPQEEASGWHELVYNIAGPTVSPGGVLMYCPVSRAAVYKRMKEGKLTAFNFYPSGQATKLFDRILGVREMPYCYIPISEAKAWRLELEERALSLGKITPKELEEARKKGDWAYQIIRHGKITVEELQGIKPEDEVFLIWNSKWQRQQAEKTKGGKK